MSERYEYLDKEGLIRFNNKIKETYATQTSQERVKDDLEQLISDEYERALGVENSLQADINQEISYARSEESRIESKADTIKSEALTDRIRIEGKFDSEIQTSRDTESDLSARDTEIDNRITSVKGELEGLISEGDSLLSDRIDLIDSSKVSGVRVNGVNVVDSDNIARIQLTDFNPNISILVKKRDEFPEIGDNSKLYVDEDTSVIWQWDANNDKYIEAGKFNVLEVEDEQHLPEIGDSEVLYISKDDRSIYMWIWDGNEEHTEFEDKWQEISGQDKELRAEFEAYKGHHHNLDDIDDLENIEVSWSNVTGKPDTYTPAIHAHNDIYYTKEEVDNRIHTGAVSFEDLEEHENSSHPHPTLEASITESLSQKASLSLLSSHTTNRDNPHGVTKEQVGLGNVDNTSDADKPISTATQEALNNKTDKTYVDEELLTKVGYDDIIDNLYTHQTNQALSAEQGTKLDAEIKRLENDTISLVRVLKFKGKVASYEELIQIENPIIGDAYQINSGSGQSADGEMYAYNGVINPSIYEEPEEPVVEPGEEGGGEEGSGEEPTPEINPEDYGWVKIIASATDISQWAATLAEVHQIIDFYGN